MPFGVSGQTTTQMQYVYQGVASNIVTVPVTPANPGLFTLDSTGSGVGAVLDSTYRVISADNPARKNDVILLFATGGGVTTPSSVDGQVALTPPFPTLTAKVGVSIGGVDCPVWYSGGAQYLVAGALQINVQMLSTVPSGVQPVVVTIGGVSSSAQVTIVVQ